MMSVIDGDGHDPALGKLSDHDQLVIGVHPVEERGIRLIEIGHGCSAGIRQNQVHRVAGSHEVLEEALAGIRRWRVCTIRRLGKTGQRNQERDQQEQWHLDSIPDLAIQRGCYDETSPG